MCSLHVDHMTDHMRNRGNLHNALLLYFTLDVCELNSDMCLDEVDMLHVTGHEGDMEAAVSCQRLRSCSERHRILCLWCRIGSCIHGIRGRHIVQRVKSFMLDILEQGSVHCTQKWISVVTNDHDGGSCSCAQLTFEVIGVESVCAHGCVTDAWATVHGKENA